MQIISSTFPHSLAAWWLRWLKREFFSISFSLHLIEHEFPCSRFTSLIEKQRDRERKNWCSSHIFLRFKFNVFNLISLVLNSWYKFDERHYFLLLSYAANLSQSLWHENFTVIAFVDFSCLLLLHPPLHSHRIEITSSLSLNILSHQMQYAV